MVFKISYTNKCKADNKTMEEQKISELKEAMRDDLFLDDLREISEDFKAGDFRSLPCLP